MVLNVVKQWMYSLVSKGLFYESENGRGYSMSSPELNQVKVQGILLQCTELHRPAISWCILDR